MFKRGTSLKGPATVKIGLSGSPSGAETITIRTKGDITSTFGINTFDIMSSEKGRIDQRRDSITIQLQFEPIGQITPDMVHLLWGWLNKPAGTSIFGAVDRPVIITPLTGKEQITLNACAITNMPDIAISAIATTIGQITIEAIISNETAWEASAARYNIANVAAPSLAALDPTTIPTMPAKIRFGAADPWLSLSSREGVKVSFDMQTSDEITDEDGLVDKTLGAVTATATFTPMGPSVSDVLNRMGLQGPGVRRGSSIAATALTFEARTADYGGIYVVFPHAAIVSAPLAWGLDTPRIGDLTVNSLPISGVVADVGILELLEP